MNRFLSFLLLVVVFNPIAAQSQPPGTAIKWGTEQEKSRRSSVTGFLGKDDLNVFVSAYEKSDLQIVKLDKNLNVSEVYTFEEKDPITKLKYEFEGFRYFNDRLFVMKSFQNKDAKMMEIYIEEISKKTMTGTGKVKMLSSYPYNKNRQKGYFDMKTSPEDNCFALVENIPTDEKGVNQLHIITYDSSFVKINEKDINPSFPGIDKYGTKSIRIDDEGNLFILVTVAKPKDEQSKDEQRFVYHMLTYKHEGGDYTDYEITMPGLYITDISFRMNNDNTISVGGFYSKSGYGSIDGCFYKLLNAFTKSTLTSSTKEFDINFVTEGMSERQEAKAKRREEKGKDQEMGSFYLDDIIRRDDGGVVLVAEQFYTYIVTYQCGNSFCSTTYYVYNDIIAINVDPKGQIEWNVKIPKRQKTANDGGFYSSYTTAVVGGDIHFIFNDHDENLEPGKQRDWKNFSFGDKHGVVTIVTLNKDGKASRRALVKADEMDVAIRPKVCSQIDDDKILLFGQRRKAEQFGIVTFK